MLWCAHNLDFPPKKKKQQIWEILVSFCLKLGPRGCAPVRSWNWFKEDNKKADRGLSKVDSTRQDINNPQLKGKVFNWVVEMPESASKPCYIKEDSTGWLVHHQQEEDTRHLLLFKFWIVCEGSNRRKHILWQCAHFEVFKAYFETYYLPNMFTTLLNVTFFQLFQTSSNILPDIFLSYPKF